MDALCELLEDLKHQGHCAGHFLGLLHILIGRRLTKADGTLISPGLTWRDLAALLKKVRWGKESVRELGLEPKQLAPRDRQRYWYLAISRARVDSPAALQAGERLAIILRQKGYVIAASKG